MERYPQKLPTIWYIPIIARQFVILSYPLICDQPLTRKVNLYESHSHTAVYMHKHYVYKYIRKCNRVRIHACVYIIMHA